MVVEKIFQHAHNTPEKIAIYDDGRPISYREFAIRISHAHQLLSQYDLRVGSVAALSKMSQVDLWVFGLALRSLGLTTVHIHALAALGDCGLHDIACAVTSIRNAADRIPPAIKVGRIVKVPDRAYVPATADAAPAMYATKTPPGGHILLTSGTTGARKKVLIESSHLAANLERNVEIFGLSGHSIVNVHSYALWTGIGYKFPPYIWTLGGAVVFWGRPGLHRSLDVDGITHTFWNPSLLSHVLNAPANEIRRHDSMRLFIGGSRLPVGLAQEAQKRLTPNIFVVVSSTEAWTWAITRIERMEDLRSHCIHPSRDAQVVDAFDNPVPTGQSGIVRIRILDGLTGYLDDEEASREFFRGGYFYPGDLGTFLPDGRLVLEGRVTNVINVLGSKIAAEPVETALQERLGAEAVCVFSVPTEERGEELHVAVESRQPISAVEVARAIRARLPVFSNPHIHLVTTLPRNSGGKIDRDALKRTLLDTKTG